MMLKKYKIKELQLQNGLTVFYCHTPDLVSFETSIHINTGARDETKKTTGISHFLEHMMFRGSNKYPNSRLLAFAMEGFGGETNAMTGIDNTNYWIKGDAEKTLEAIECFSYFFLQPNYADLDIERHVILQEMASDFNEEGLSVDTESLGMSTLFSEHPLGNSIIGSEDSIKNMGIDELENKRKTFYIPSNCVITIQTSFSEEIVKTQIEKYFAHEWDYANKTILPRLSALNCIPNKKDLRKSQNMFCLQNNPDNQFAMKVIFPCHGNLSKNIVNITFLQRILDDGICTRLPAIIREKFGLVYDISCDTQFFQEVGTFSVDATVSEEYLTDLLEKLGKELRSILIEKPLEDEIEHIKYRYIFDLKQIQETPSRLLSRKVTEHFMKSEFSIEEELEYVNSINSEMILQTVKSIFGAGRRAFVLVGPKARKKRELVEKFLSNFDI